MNSFSQERQSTQTDASDLTNMATGTIDTTMKEDEIFKENQTSIHTLDQTINHSFIKHTAPRHVLPPNNIQDDGLMRYVTRAFTEVCKKIDSLHRMVEEQKDAQKSTEKEGHRNSTEEKEEIGWLDRLKQIIYGKEDEEIEEILVSQRYLKEEESEKNMQINTEGEESLKKVLGLVEETATRRYQEKYAEVFEAANMEERRKDAEIKYHKTRANAAEESLKRATEQISVYKARLKMRKKEMSDIKSSFTMNSAAEISLSKVATASSMQVARILLLLDKPDAIEQIYQEVKSGETGKLVSSLLEIESAIRDIQHRERAAHDKAQREKQQISKQIKICAEEAEQVQKDNQKLLKELEEKQAEIEKHTEKMDRINEEKDAIINKQRLMIKLLNSKLTRPSRTVQDTGKEEKRTLQSIVSEKPKSKIEQELEERISNIKNRLEQIHSIEDPLYKVSLKDLEDSRRRLNDFMKI